MAEYTFVESVGLEMTDHTQSTYHFFSCDRELQLQQLGATRLLEALDKMLLIRQFERRSEVAYQQGFIGGFFHSYAGQEAIQVAATMVLGPDNWYITSYRCHALALLLGATPNELMAELYGRSTGNAKGRGGSMHFFTERLLGGFGIVAGQVPIATGAAFAIKYRHVKGEVAICFLGDGAVAQGAFHESVNLASLWDLPCIYVVENNLWGMGTSVERAIAGETIVETKAPAYDMKGYTFDGTDFVTCYAGFQKVFDEVLSTQRPVMIEAIAERFRGHSVSDPGLYRSKEDLQQAMQQDPIEQLKRLLIEHRFLNEHRFEEMDNANREKVVAAMQFAEQSPWPDVLSLEDDVYAPAGDTR